MVIEFRDNDDDYVDWLGGNPDGYVLNIARAHNAAGARVHEAECRTIQGQIPRGGTWTGPYVKVCSDHLADLDAWALNKLGETMPRCGICHPSESAASSIVRADAGQAAGTAGGGWNCEIKESEPGVVEAWSDDYIRFERRPPWQERFREGIRARCRQIEPSCDQVLHATFFGDKHPKADIENLVLYNIDSFKAAGRNGIRFEHGALAGGAGYRFGYRYSLAERADSFCHWRAGDDLAAFDWTSLGEFKSEKKLAQVWLALSRAEVKAFKDLSPETHFGVRLEVRPPHGRKPVWGGLLKGIFDGVICAFQAQSEKPVSRDVLERLGTYLSTDSDEIEDLLGDRTRAVLGEVSQLASPYRSGVKWDPADHLCVAGELLAVEPTPGDEHWWIKGEIFEVFRP